MPVTTANTIRFSDVCQEIYGSSSTSGRSLMGAHNEATGVFDSNFNTQGTVRTLLDFRGYNHVQRAIVIVSNFSPNNHGDACAPNPAWAESYFLFVNVATFGQIVSGTQLFSTSNTATPFNGTNGFYRLTDNNNAANVITVYQNQGSGIILSREPCAIVVNPLTPTGLYQVSTNGSGILAAWDNMINATDYNLYINGNFAGNTGGSNSFNIQGVNPSDVYEIQVSSVRGSFESLLSGIIIMGGGFQPN